MLDQRFMMPPMPGEEPPERPRDFETLQMTASGMAVTAAALLGLQSFRGTGHLYGTLGEVSERPMSALAELLRYGRDLLTRGEPGAGQAAEAGMINYAMARFGGREAAGVAAHQASDDIDPELLERYRNRRARSQEAAQLLTERRAQGAITRTTEEWAEREESLDRFLLSDEDYRQRVVDLFEDEVTDPFFRGDTSNSFWETLTSRKWKRETGRLRGWQNLLKRYERQNNLSRDHLDLARRKSLYKPGNASRYLAEIDPDFEGTKGDLRQRYLFGFLSHEAGYGRDYVERVGIEQTFRRMISDRHHLAMARLLHRFSEVPFHQAISDSDLEDMWRQYQRVGTSRTADTNPINLRRRLARDSGFSQFVFRQLSDERGPQMRPTTASEAAARYGSEEGDYPFERVSRRFPGLTDPTQIFSDLLDNIDPTRFQDLGNYVQDGAEHLMRSGEGLGRPSTLNTPGLVDDIARDIERTFSDLSLDTTQRIRDEAERTGRGRTGSAQFRINKVGVDDRHASYEIQWDINGRTDSVEVALPSEHGTYKTRGMNHPVTGKMTLLFENDLFMAPLKDKLETAGRIKPLVTPSELALWRVKNYLEKVSNDTVERQDPGDIARFVQSLVDKTFKATTNVENSFGEMLTKGSMIQTQAAVVFREIMESDLKRDRLDDGLTSVRRMRRLFETGHRYFSTDTEFTSTGSMMGRGLTPYEGAQGKSPYEIGGTIFEAGHEGRAVASISFTPQLFNENIDALMGRTDLDAHERHLVKMREGMERFQRLSAGASDEEWQALLEKTQRGHLEVRAGGDTYDLLQNQDQSRFATKYDVRPMGPDEDLTSYYTRVQEALLKKEGVRFSVGQNYLGAELGIFEQIWKAAGRDLPEVMNRESVIDTLMISHVLSPNDMDSRSLSNITATLMGFTSDEYTQAREELLRVQRGDQSWDELFDKNPSGAEDEFYRGVRSALDQGDLPADFRLHTANFDAFVTGRFVIPRMARRLRDYDMRKTTEAMSEAMSKHRQLAGQFEYIEQQGGINYGEFKLNQEGEAEYSGGAYLGFAGQEAAAFGEASLLHPRILPFAALQNPVRQLYQRIKPRLLLNPIRNHGDLYDVGEGIKLPSSARFRPSWQPDKPADIYAGHGSLTERGLGFYGGWEGSNRQATEVLTAMLPENHPLIYGSRARQTRALSEAMRSAQVLPSTLKVKADQAPLTEGMDEWISRTAARHNLPQHAEADLQQIYMLQRLFDTPSAGAASETRALITESIEKRWRSIFGEEQVPEDILQSAFKQARQEDASVSVSGKHKTLFSPLRTPDSIVHEDLRGAASPEAVGLDIKVRLHSRGADTATIEIDYIDEKGSNQKYMVEGMAKGYATGVYSGEMLGVHGEQLAIEAGFASMKRSEYGGRIAADLTRIRYQINRQLQQLDPTSLEDAKAREEIINKAARALSALTGGKMKPDDIRRKVLETKLATDRIRIKQTDAFDKAVEAAWTPRASMKAMKEVDLTMGEAIKQTAMRTGDPTGSALRSTEIASTQIDKLIEGVKNEVINETAGTDSYDELHDLLDDLKAQKSQLDTFKGHLNSGGDLHEGAAKLDRGALFDFHVDPTSGRHSVAYIGLASTQQLERGPVTSATGLGEEFERHIGRPTKHKRSGMLSTVLLGHSGTYGQGFAPESGAFFKGYLASRSGYVAFSDKVFQRELLRALDEHGIDASAEDLKENLSFENGEYIYMTPTGPIHLDVNPLTTLTDQTRLRLGLGGMLAGELDEGMTVSGVKIGERSRILKLGAEGDMTLRELQARFGREQRAIMHQRFKLGVDPSDIDITDAARAATGNLVYFGPGEGLEDSPFDRSKDLIGLRLYEGLEDEDLRRLRKTLGNAGFDERQIEQVLGGKRTVEEALMRGIDDPTEQKRLQAALRMMGFEDGATPRQIAVATATGSFAPKEQRIGGATALALNPVMAQLMEATDAVETVESAVQRIHQQAERLRNEDITQGEFRARVADELLNPDVRAASGEVQRLWQSSLNTLMRQMGRVMEDATGSFLGGQFNVSSSQSDMLPALEDLRLFADDGDRAGFRSAVDRLLRRNDEVKAEAMVGTDAWDERVRRAESSLWDYITNQKGETWEWRGFGALEGFVSTEVLQDTIDQMEAMPTEDLAQLKNVVPEGTDPEKMVQEELQRLRSELKSAGSTSGLLATTARHPDYTQWAGYETSRLTALDRYGMIALGADPQQVHAASSPLPTWSRREDFDGDLTYMSIINDPVVSAMKRNTTVKGAAEQMAVLHQVMEGRLNRLGTDEVDLDGPFREVRYQDDPDLPGLRRVLHPVMEGDMLFEDMVESKMGFAGAALRHANRGRDARVGLSLLKQTAGTFGAFSKQGATQVLALENAFTDMVAGLADFEKQTGANLDQAFGGTLRRTDSGMTAGGWDFLKRTWEEVERVRGQHGASGEFDLLQRAVLATNDIAQQVAIEKYKGADHMAWARKMETIMEGIWGRGDMSMDEAWSALQAEDKFNLEDYFGEIADRELSPREALQRQQKRAAKGMGLFHDVMRGYDMMKSIGLRSDYYATAANMSKGELPPTEDVTMGTAAFREFVGQSGAAANQEAAAEVFRNASGSATRFEWIRNMLASDAESITSTGSWQDRLTQSFESLPQSARLGLGAGMAGLAVLAIAGPSPDQQRFDGETYDLPQQQRRVVRGSRQTTQRMMKLRDQGTMEALRAQMPGEGYRQQHAARRPPPIYASY